MDLFDQKVDNLKIIVFDLDYTLWPFWVDTHVCPPFRIKNGQVFDSCGYVVKHYSEVPQILTKLKSIGYKLGIASRTSATVEAQELLKLFDWDKHFEFKQIFPGRKTEHFLNIHKESGHSFSQMLFFDDESRNIRDLKQSGVVSILVENGLDFRVINHGINQFNQINNKINY